MTKKTKTASGWAIVGDCGLYIGWWLTRQDAIDGHCEAFRWLDRIDPINRKAEWKARQKDGDQVVKVQISYDNIRKQKSS
jgi:hypothetical protein